MQLKVLPIIKVILDLGRLITFTRISTEQKKYTLESWVGYDNMYFEINLQNIINDLTVGYNKAYNINMILHFYCKWRIIYAVRI